MQVHTFIADSAADAVAQIRETLGPDAVVLNVRRAATQGFARLWHKPRIEVLAHVPEKITAPTGATDVLAELREELREIKQKVEHHKPETADATTDSALHRIVATPTEGWRVGALLENSGLLPFHAQSVVEELRRTHGDLPPEQLRREIEMVSALLASRWREPKLDGTGAHVFVGAPGTGKTTALCKWLAHSTLVGGRSAAVWRLDGGVANTAEALGVYCEILGVPMERSVPHGARRPDADKLFIDLPGVNPDDADGMNELARQLSSLPDAQAHLVLNAAYETPLLMAQVRRFAALGVNDVIVTHLDEETNWSKLWNLVLGTNCTLRWLSAGQNIPGEFLPATPGQIFSRQFPQKRALGHDGNAVADGLLKRG